MATSARSIGQVLRLAGPALQVLCLITLLSRRGAGAGGEASALEIACYIGFVVGVVLVVAGLMLTSWGGGSHPDGRRGDGERPRAEEAAGGQGDS